MQGGQGSDGFAAALPLPGSGTGSLQMFQRRNASFDRRMCRE